MQDEFMPLYISTKIENPSKYIQNSTKFELDALATIRVSSYGRVLSLVDERGRDSVVSKLQVATLGLDGPS